MYTYKARIIDVYDGDTVAAELDLGLHIKVTKKLRLYGINAPEIRGKQRPEGLEARDFLRALILDKEVIVETIKDKKGKYGRYLANIKVKEDGLEVSSVMVAANQAEWKEY